MGARATEWERKFVADAGFVPDLSAVAVAVPTATHHLVATYHDTLGLDLTRAGWSLRRRTGGRDDGWHLKRPASGDARVEASAPLSDALPAAFRAELRELVDSAALVPVARLETRRRESVVRVGGTPVAILAEDEVIAHVGGRSEAWEELEGELEPGVDPGLLEVLGAALEAGGARPAAHASKIARALAWVVPLAEPSGSDAPARDVLLAYLARQGGTLQWYEPGVRTDAPDAVHKARVATRRLRSALGAFGRLFRGSRVAEVRAELRWLGEALGAPRDAEVLREEFGDLLAELGPDAGPGVRNRLLGHLDAVHARSHAALVEVLDSPRAAGLREELTGLLVEPPWRGGASAPARDVLPGLVGRAGERGVALRERAEAHPRDLERWHEVRMAAKEVRYCTEARRGAFGADMAARAGRWTEVTEAFGTLQDAVVARGLLRALERDAAASGEPTRTWDVLRDIQRDRATAALAEGRRALTRALAAES